ncbi:MAG: DUF1611 domain-containing protein [Fidelibacterota bacterium]
MSPLTRYAILVDGAFDYLLAKTGNAILRYCPQEVVCVIDSQTAGKTVEMVLGWGGSVPVVAGLRQALEYEPDTLLIGTAPPGGRLPESWRSTVRQALKKKLRIVSGLHTFLSDDEEFASLARKNHTSLIDLRKPPKTLPFSKGSWRWRKTPVVLTVGTDCDTGKMTTAWEIKTRLEEAGKRVSFVGTGQTGILLGGFGVAVDAVVSDFVAGAIEDQIDKADSNTDVIMVEGQGSLTHMAYSGVTLGLLHGAMPDMMILCHEPGRRLDTFDHPMRPVREIMDLYLKMVTVFRPSRFVGISLLTYRMNEKTALKTTRAYRTEYQMPAADLVRFGDKGIADAIIQRISPSTG